MSLIRSAVAKHSRGSLLSLVSANCGQLSSITRHILTQRCRWTAGIRSASTSVKPLLCEKLTNRHIVKLSGPDSGSFLQGLITNDVDALYTGKDSLSALYAMMLNVKGRVLYDLIIYRLSTQPDDLLVECNADVNQELLKTFKRYKLRKKVELSDVSDKINVWAAFSSTFDLMHTDTTECRAKEGSKPIGLVTDPRLNYFSYRLLIPSSISDGSSVLENSSVCVGEYDKRRYQVGLSEGTLDLPPGECLPLESNLAFLNGVSFDKGCYVGQELTARTQYTGVIRKRLMPLVVSRDAVIDKSCTIETSGGKSCGKIRHFTGRHGLGLLRVEEVVGKGPLLIRNSSSEVICEAETFVPQWWKTSSDEIMKKTIAKQTEDDL